MREILFLLSCVLLNLGFNGSGKMDAPIPVANDFIWDAVFASKYLLIRQRLALWWGGVEWIPCSNVSILW